MRSVIAEQLVLRRTSAIDPVGMTLRSRGGKEVVMAVEAGSPAAAAGVRVGDVLLAVGARAVLSVEQVKPLQEVAKPGHLVALWRDVISVGCSDRSRPRSGDRSQSLCIIGFAATLAPISIALRTA